MPDFTICLYDIGHMQIIDSYLHTLCSLNIGYNLYAARCLQVAKKILYNRYI